MKRRHHSFNIYFTLFCVALVAGCASDKQSQDKRSRRREQSTIRLYLEGQHADKTTSGTVLVTRDRIPFTVERDPFLDEGDLTKASIVENPDGSYYIQLLFNDHGALLLDMFTASNKGRHIIVFSQFPTPSLKSYWTKKRTDDSNDVDLVDKTNAQPPPGTERQSGWLAAVLVRDRISNGSFGFTPDASRAECNRIVRGLRNVIAKNKHAEK